MQNKIDNNIVFIATGGTGGHIFPALALAYELEQSGYKVIITADNRFEKYHKFDSEHIYVPAANFVNKSPLKLIQSVCTIAYGVIKALLLIIKFNPKTVIGFGGYPSFPTVKAASILGKEIILHEANVVLGRTNACLLGKAKYLTTGFKEIDGVALQYQNKVIYTGNPVRKEISPALSKNDHYKLSILIIGGSQGAKIFSKIIPDMLRNLPKEIKSNIHVCHQVKKEDIDNISNIYDRQNISHEVKEFFSDMDVKLKQTDLVISRAGASTIAELIKTRVPAIFIPYPTAVDNHQHLNAKILSDAKAAWIVPESATSHTSLLKLIQDIYKNPNILKEYANNISALDQFVSKHPLL